MLKVQLYFLFGTTGTMYQHIEALALCRIGAVVAQWIRPQTLNREVPSWNLLAAAAVPLG